MTPDFRNARLYTMGDANYFLGIVALINSLRITGNEQSVTVLDLGMTSEQRSILAPHCDFIEREQVSGMTPWVLAPFPKVVEPVGLIGIIDSDIIITARLDEFFAQAANGKVVVFPDPVYPNRHFTEWQASFSLRNELRSGQPYVNAGCIFFSASMHGSLLSRWWECCEQIAGNPTMLDDMDDSAPLAFGSQDALNALLMSEVAVEGVAIQSVHAERYLDFQADDALEVMDREALLCTHEGYPVSILHRFWVNKPWQRGSWKMMRPTAFVACLRRVLAGTNLEVRVPQSELPPWLKPGPSGAFTLNVTYAIYYLQRPFWQLRRSLYLVKKSLVQTKVWRRFRSRSEQSND